MNVLIFSAGKLSYINNPGFSVTTNSQYQVTLQMQDQCGTATTVVDVTICDTVRPSLNIHTASAIIVEQQVVDYNEQI